MPEALFAVIFKKGKAEIQRVGISHANDRFYILEQPYPLPNGYAKRIFNRNEEILPDSPITAVKYYLSNLDKYRMEFEQLLEDIATKEVEMNRLLNSLQNEHKH